MKKIVSMLAVAALALSAVSAADISVEYATKGTIYSEKATQAAGATQTTVDSKTFLDQKGYDDDALSCITFSASSDIGGVCLDLDADARNLDLERDQIYGWMNFGNLQLTTGAWTGRYVNRVKADANNWANADFEKFKPGIVCGADGKGIKAAYDVDNLTAIDTKQQLATALAYTVRPSDATYIMAKGVIVKNSWGGTGRFDSDKKYAAGDYDIKFNSSFAGELAIRQDGVIDFNAVVKSQVRDQLIAAAFIRPLMMDKVNLLIGGTYAANLADREKGKNAYAYGVDLRARIVLSDTVAVTTMNNFSSQVSEVADDEDPISIWSMWNMVSVAYKVSDAMTFQVTGESYMDTFRMTAPDGKSTKAVGRTNLGGSDVSVLAGVVYKLNDNASFSGAVKYSYTDAFSTNDWDKANAHKAEVSVPFVFNVAL